MKNRIILFQQFSLLACLIASCLLSSCTTNRSTGNYDDIPELVGTEKPIAVQDDREKLEKERRMLLTEILHAENMPYAINAGDVLDITVYNHPDLSTRETIVTPDGCIGMAFIGQVQIGGKSLNEAAKLIENGLRDYIKNPSVILYPRRINSETVSINGSVETPGMYPIAKGMRLADCIAQAHGFEMRLLDGQTLIAADLLKSKFVRNGIILPIDFTNAIENADLLDNIEVQKGDNIFIAERTQSMVSIIGDITSPRRCQWDSSMGIIELLTYCGGLNETYWNYCIVIRGGINHTTIYKIDLDGILHGRKKNVPLESNDIVYIPKDNITWYNVFIRKLFPTGQLFSTIASIFHAF